MASSQTGSGLRAVATRSSVVIFLECLSWEQHQVPVEEVFRLVYVVARCCSVGAGRYRKLAFLTRATVILALLMIHDA